MRNFFYLFAIILFSNGLKAQWQPNVIAIDPVVQLPPSGGELIWYTTNGYITQYDTLGWINYSKFVTLKNDAGRYYNYEDYFFNRPANMWDTGTIVRNSFTTDNNNNLVEILSKRISNGGITIEKITIAYQGGRIESSISEKSYNGGPFENPEKTYYLYNQSGKRIKDSTVKTSTTPQQTVSEYQYLYDGNNRCIKESYVRFVPVMATQWFNELEYYPNGSMKKYTRYTQRPVTGLGHSFKNEYTYNADGTVETCTVYNRFSADSLKLFQINKNYYNSQKVLTGITQKQYMSNTWVNMDSTALKPFATGSYDTSYHYQWDGVSWDTILRLIFFKTTAGVSEIATGTKEFVAYPNPATEKTRIDLEDVGNRVGGVILTDITGKRVNNVAVITSDSKGIEISLANLAPGIYVLHTRQQSIKIIKQ